MAKPLKDIIRGSKSTKVEKLSTGKDPGVDYDPKAPDDRKFVAKHVVAKHDWTGRNDDAVFNGDNIQRKPNRETNKGYDRPEDERVYGIQGEETVNEISDKLAKSYIGNAIPDAMHITRGSDNARMNLARAKTPTDKASWKDESKYFDRKATNRSGGIELAARKVVGTAKVPTTEETVEEGKTWKDSKGAKDSAKYGSKESWGRKREYDSEKLRARGDKPDKHRQLLGVSEESLEEKAAATSDQRHDKENKRQAFKDYVSTGKLKTPKTTKKINLAKEEAECNHSPKGKPCPVHGMAEYAGCSTLKEKPVTEAMSRNNVNAFVKASGHGAAPAELHKEHPHVSFARKRFDVATKGLNLSKEGHAKLHGAFQASVKADTKGERAHGFVDQIEHGVKLHQQSAMRDYHRVKTQGATINDRREKIQADIKTHHTEEYDLSDELIEQICEGDTSPGVNITERGWIEDYVAVNNPRLAEKTPTVVNEENTTDCWYFLQYETQDAAAWALTESEQKGDDCSVRLMGNGKIAYRGNFTATRPEINEDLAVPLLGETDPTIHPEVDKTKAELKAIANKAMHIHMMGSDKLHMHYGMKDKITAARKMLGDVHDHMCFSTHERVNRALENEEQAPVDQTIGSLTPSPQPANSFPDYNDDNHVGANV